jgi:hypothetical protein
LHLYAQIFAGENMTKDEIMSMAREANLPACHTTHPKALERFAKLVAEHERSECADMVFRYISQTVNMEARGCLASVAYDIRARGEQA